ncbi:hypothetical protein STTU_4322 [Streptomyces sp. Tu6071]|nr:hypothetical protein STTU_4322 [Streptomyces sp. Tu6071]
MLGLPPNAAWARLESRRVFRRSRLGADRVGAGLHSARTNRQRAGGPEPVGPDGGNLHWRE